VPADLLIIDGGTVTGTTSIFTHNLGTRGLPTRDNGIRLIETINGATTAPGAFGLGQENRVGALTYNLFKGGLSGASPQDWFLRSTFIVPAPAGSPTPTNPDGTPASGLPGLLPEGAPATVLPVDPPPAVLPPGLYPILGPELATYGVVQPLARQVGLTVLGTLHERIGDTLSAENTGWPANPAWGRFIGQQIDNRYEAFVDPTARGRILGFQGGYDVWRGSLVPDHRDAAGAYFAYGNLDATVNGIVTNDAATTYIHAHTGTVRFGSYTGGLYWTHYGPAGWYLDLVVQGTLYNGDATAQAGDLQTRGYGFLPSLEAGYPVPLPFGPNFVLEPQAQIAWQRVGFHSSSDSQGAVDLGSTSGASGRVGARALWTIVDTDGSVWQPSVRANLWHDWDGKATTSFDGDEVPLREQATRVELAAGLTTKVNASFSVYAQAGYQFAVGDTEGSRRDGVRGDVGIRFAW
jgi:outer membrane autotransporter protein